jgi:hypothetical protein
VNDGRVDSSARNISTRRSVMVASLGFLIGASLALLLMYVFSAQLLGALASYKEAKRLSRVVVLVDGATLVQDGKIVGRLNAGVSLVRLGSAAEDFQELTLEFASERSVGPRFEMSKPSSSRPSTVLLVKEPTWR